MPFEPSRDAINLTALQVTYGFKGHPGPPTSLDLLSGVAHLDYYMYCHRLFSAPNPG